MKKIKINTSFFRRPYEMHIASRLSKEEEVLIFFMASW